jgi:iron complex transport system permease protein
LLISPDASLHSMLFWLMGDLNDAHLSWVSPLILVSGLGLCWLLAPAFNILGRGEKEARALGLPIKPYRLLIFLLSSLFAAAAVTQAGCIGFVGLIVPHFARRLIGYHHRYMLPAAVLLGGSLVVIADTLARSLFAPQQIPVGIIIAIIGIPVFISLIQA